MGINENAEMSGPGEVDNRSYLFSSYGLETDQKVKFMIAAIVDGGFVVPVNINGKVCYNVQNPANGKSVLIPIENNLGKVQSKIYADQYNIPYQYVELNSSYSYMDEFYDLLVQQHKERDQDRRELSLFAIDNAINSVINKQDGEETWADEWPGVSTMIVGHLIELKYMFARANQTSSADERQ